ncbi:MAG: monovalent cation/H(+) antiporter subunit G [Chloroflexi bacterium]|nr:monovalent cation/H(+) antiporter subunit G [Chloroflexota bacterium]MCH7655482.1 monovalent cation/H(+) antiporter subunit G [Chloroflexota bacterium]
MSIVGTVLLGAGLFFMASTAIGLARLPDFFTRVHSVSKSETLGITLVLLGLIAHEGFDQTSLKLGLIALFVATTNPVAAHVLTRSAVRSGLMPWRRPRPPAGGTG